MAGLNDKYKNWHKPVEHSDKVKFQQGYYSPIHPEKCLTTKNIYRSSWERLFMQYCDLNENVVRWASEPVGIPYLNPVANMKYCVKQGLNPNDPHNWKRSMYYTDFWIELKDNITGNIKRIFIEIKPYKETQQPQPIKENASMKEHKAYNRSAEIYLVNQAKWVAAKKYFESKGAEFMVMTEKTLQKLGLYH